METDCGTAWVTGSSGGSAAGSCFSQTRPNRPPATRAKIWAMEPVPWAIRTPIPAPMAMPARIGPTARVRAMATSAWITTAAAAIFSPCSQPSPQVWLTVGAR